MNKEVVLMIYYSESKDNLDALLGLLIDIYLEIKEEESNDECDVSEMQ